MVKTFKVEEIYVLPDDVTRDGLRQAVIEAQQKDFSLRCKGTLEDGVYISLKRKFTLWQMPPEVEEAQPDVPEETEAAEPEEHLETGASKPREPAYPPPAKLHSAQGSAWAESRQPEFGDESWGEESWGAWQPHSQSHSQSSSWRQNQWNQHSGGRSGAGGSPCHVCGLPRSAHPEKRFCDAKKRARQE